MKKIRRREAARVPVIAAGGIVIRGSARPLVAVVQRRKDGWWVLPKGKLKQSEKPIAAAQREAAEETGYEVRLHEFLGAISYEAGGKPKIVHFWRMRIAGSQSRELARDIKAVEWLPLSSAVERLTQPIERAFLDHVGGHAVSRSRATRSRPTAKRRRAGKYRNTSPQRGRKTRRSESRAHTTRAKKSAAAGRNIFGRLMRRLRPDAANSPT